MDNSGERNASRRGRGRQHLPQPTDGGTPATAQLAFLLGMLIQLMQEPGAMTPQPPTSLLPSDNLLGLNAPQSTSPSRFQAPLLPRSPAESHDEAEDTSSGTDASAERTRGAKAVPPGLSDSWLGQFNNLLSLSQNARPGAEQPTTTKRKKPSHPAGKLTFPQSRSAPSQNSQTLTPPLLPGEVSRRVLPETRPTTPQNYPTSCIQVPFQPLSAAEAHDEEDTSDATDTKEFTERKGSDSWQTQLLEILSKLQSAGYGAEPSATKTTARRGEGSAQLTRHKSFPQSMSAPSPRYQSHPQFFGSDRHQSEDSEPSPPPSPVSESLENYLQTAYIKWKTHQRATVQRGDAKESRSRVVHRRSRQPSRARKNPAGLFEQFSRWSWPGHVTEESQLHSYRGSQMSRHSDVVGGIHSKPHGSLSGRSRPRFAVADEDPSDDSIESSGEDSHKYISHLEVERCRESSSAPSPYRNTPASANDLRLEYDGQAYNSQHMQRSASAVWNPYVTSETLFTRKRRPFMPRQPSHKFTHNLHGRGTFPRTRDPFASSRPQFWTETFSVNNDFAVDPTGEPYSSLPVPRQADAMQPVSMTVQFYNHHGHASTEGHTAALPLHPPPSGITHGTPMQTWKRRSSSTTEDHTSRPTETRRGTSHARKAKSHTSNTTPLSSVEEKGSDSGTESVHRQQAQNDVQHGASGASSPSDLTHDHGQRGESSHLSFPVTEVGTRERRSQVGSPSSIAVALPSSATATAGATSTGQLSLKRSRIPVPVRQTSMGRKQSLTSSSFSSPLPLRSDIGPQPAAAPPSTHAPQVSSPGYMQVETLEQDFQSGAATANKQPSSPGSRYHTAQSLPGYALSLLSASQYQSSTMRAEGSAVHAAPSSVGWVPSHLPLGGTGRTTRAADVPQKVAVENSFVSLSQQQPRRSLSTRSAFVGTHTSAFDSLPRHPVEDEFTGGESVD